MKALGMTISVVLFLTILGAVTPHAQASHAGPLDCNNPSTFHNAYEYSGCFTEEEKRELWETSIDSFEISRYRANLRERFRFSSPTYDDVAVNTLLDFLEQNGYWYLTGPERRYFAVRFRSKPLMRHLLFLEGGSWQIPLDATPYVVDVVENFYRIGAQTDVDNPLETLAFAANFWVTLFDATEGVMAPTPKSAPGEFVQDRNGKKRFQELYPDRYEALYTLGFPVSGVFDQPVFNRKRQDITKPQNQLWTDKELQFLQSGLKIADGRFARDPDADYREWITNIENLTEIRSMVTGITAGFALNKQLAPLGLLFPFPCAYFKIKADGGHLRWANAEECQMMLLLAGGMIASTSLVGDYAESIGLNQTRAMMVAQMEREAAGDILGFSRNHRFSPYDLDAIFSHEGAARMYEIMRANYLLELTEVGYFVPTQIIRPTTALAPWVPRVTGSVGSELWRALWNRKKFAFDPEPWTQWLDGFWDKLSQTGVPERGVSAKSYRQALRVYRAIEGGETDPGVLTLMLDMDFPLVTLQDMASLATIRGNGIPTNLALATRSKLLSHPEALAAFDDLMLTVRSQPSEFYAHSAYLAGQRGTLPERLRAVGKTVPQLMDDYLQWLLREYPELLFHGVRLHLGSELAQSTLRGVHPSPNIMPVVVVEYSPSALDAVYPDSPLVRKTPEEAIQVFEDLFNHRWLKETPEGRAYAEYYTLLTERVDGTETEEMVRILGVESSGAPVPGLTGIDNITGEDTFVVNAEEVIVDRNGQTPGVMYTYSQGGHIDEATQEIKVSPYLKVHAIRGRQRGALVPLATPFNDESVTAYMREMLHTNAKAVNSALVTNKHFSPDYERQTIEFSAQFLGSHITGIRASAQYRELEAWLRNFFQVYQHSPSIRVSEIRRVNALLWDIVQHRNQAVLQIAQKETPLPFWEEGQSGVITEFAVLPETFYVLEQLISGDPARTSWVDDYGLPAVDDPDSSWRIVWELGGFSVERSGHRTLRRAMRDLIIEPQLFEELQRYNTNDGRVMATGPRALDAFDEAVIQGIQQIRANGLEVSSKVEARWFTYAFRASRRLNSPRSMLDFGFNEQDFIVTVRDPDGEPVQLNLLELFDSHLRYATNDIDLVGPRELSNFANWYQIILNSLGDDPIIGSRRSDDGAFEFLNLRQLHDTPGDRPFLVFGATEKPDKWIDPVRLSHDVTTVGLCSSSAMEAGYCIGDPTLPNSETNRFVTMLPGPMRYLAEINPDSPANDAGMKFRAYTTLNTLVHEHVHALIQGFASHTSTQPLLEPMVERIARRLTERIIRAVDPGFPANRLENISTSYVGGVKMLNYLLDAVARRTHATPDQIDEDIIRTLSSSRETEDFHFWFQEIILPGNLRTPPETIPDPALGVTEWLSGLFWPWYRNPYENTIIDPGLERWLKSRGYE